MCEKKLTGKVRFRYWKKKLVLQVQYEFWHTFLAGGAVDSEWCKAWRDAQVEDLRIPVKGLNVK